MPEKQDEDQEIEKLIELLFFAYRDFIADPDAMLSEFDFGRAHHRVLHFIDRKPGLTVAELLDLLGITKQSLARVLKQLVDSDFVRQCEGENDRRRRELYLTESGTDLIANLRRPQSRRIRKALELSGQDVSEVARFLKAMIEEAALRQMQTLDSEI